MNKGAIEEEEEKWRENNEKAESLTAGEKKQKGNVQSRSV